MKKTNIIVLGISVTLLIIFYFFSRSVKYGFLKQTDFNTTVKIQERVDKSSRLRLAGFVDNILEGSTFLASPEMSVIAVGIFTLWVMIDIRKKKIRLRALAIPLLFGLLILGEIYGKSVVHHPAPPFFMIKHPTTIFPQFYINEQFSYPSGHTARAVFLALVIWLLIMQQSNNITMRKKLWIVVGLGIYVSLVSVSRIYLGHHWLSDIVGGGLLGLGLGTFVYYLL